MAIQPSAVYPAQTLVDGGYPHGRARNELVPGDGIGTPLEERWVNDLWGFLQALLAAPASPIAPNGTPDAVGSSQYLEAIQALINARFDSNGLLIVDPAGLTLRKVLTLAQASPQNAAGIPKWERVLVGSAWVWRSRSAGGEPLFFGLNEAVAEIATAGDSTVALRGAVIDAITVQMEPGIGRTGNDRMQVQLIQSRFVAGVWTETIIDAQYGSTGTGLDTQTISGIGHAIDPTADYEIRVLSGNDADTNQDVVYRVVVQYQPTKGPL